MRIDLSLVLSVFAVFGSEWVAASELEVQNAAQQRAERRSVEAVSDPLLKAAQAEIRKVVSFAPIGERVRSLGEKYGPESVLLVFDIDSTLLTMNQDLGSDHWFRWQEALPDDSDQRVAGDFAGLLKVQGLLFAIGGMSVTEPGLAERLSEWRSEGFQMMTLTARGYDFRDATRRELVRNKLSFSRNPAFPPSTLSEPVLPYRPATVNALGLPRRTAEKLSQSSPRLVTFAEGVFMSAGQDKGVMLRRVIALSQNEVAAIVFVDDGDKNLSNMRNAFSATSIEMHLFDYARLDRDAAAFMNSASRQRDVVKRWNELRTTLEEIFPTPNAISN